VFTRNDSTCSARSICCLLLLQVCRELAHLYHYYLHGPQGNVGSSSSAARAAGMLPSGEPAPEVAVEFMSGSRLLWRRSLCEVEDDMESTYLRAQRAKLDFTVNVPGKGKPLCMCGSTPAAVVQHMCLYEGNVPQHSRLWRSSVPTCHAVLL
jgi:hypothetical protein